MNKKIKILYIDDNLMDKALVRDVLEREHSEFQLSEARNKKEFEKILQTERFDLILSDFNILGFEGLQVIDFIKSNYSHIPVIIVTGTGSESIAVEAMKRSASDYIIKTPKHIRKLPESITKTIRLHRDQQARSFLVRISNALLTTSSLKGFIDIIKQELSVFFDTENFFLALYNEQKKRFDLPYFKDIHSDLKEFPASDTLTHYVLKTGKPLLIDEMGLDALIDKGEVKLYGRKSKIWMGVPLKLKDHIIGVLATQSYTDEDAYSRMDLELLESLTAPISLAIERIRINEELSNKNIALHEKIKEIKNYTARLEEAKEKAEESNRLKTAFLTNISHEIRTPMNGILGFAKLLKEPGLSDEIQSQYIDIINKSGQRLLNLISEILDISMIESGAVELHFSETNVNNTIKEIIDLLKPEAEAKGLELVYNISLPDDNAIIRTDKEKLYASLLNLTKNAVKFTNKGRVEVGYQLNKSRDKQVFEFYVSDTGPGIPGDKQEIIFDRFTHADLTNKQAHQGAGLGLAIAKGHIETMGGHIWLESKEGEGSTFYFTIPLDSDKEKLQVKNG